MAGADEAAIRHPIIRRSHRHRSGCDRPNRSAAERGDLHRRQSPDGAAQRRYNRRVSVVGQVTARICRSQSRQHRGFNPPSTNPHRGDTRRRDRAWQPHVRGEPPVGLLSRHLHGVPRAFASIASTRRGRTAGALFL